MRQPRSYRTLWLITAMYVACTGGGDATAETLFINGNVTLTVNAANAVGGGLAQDSDSITYTVANTTGTKKVVGRLNSAMPSNTVLQVQLVAPGGAASAGMVTLTASDQNLVTGIGVVPQSDYAMTFTFSANVRAGLVNAGSRTLTLTLVDAP